MPLPAVLQDRLSIPVVAAPMFLASGPDLVIAACRAGVLGTFPALNQRSTGGLEDWLVTIKRALGPTETPFGVNLIVHKTNGRLQADLNVIVRHEVPVVITSLGAVRDVVDAVHSYGGIVFHDVINVRHAEKAIKAGVDGLVLVCAGAGGHAGTLSPFALVSEVRQIFDGTVLLAGAMSRGDHVAAACAMGADLAYLGTRFIATKECIAAPEYKEMITRSHAADVVYTPSISGIPANFLRSSIAANGLDPDNLPPSHDLNAMKELNPEAAAWKTIWSAGQGVGAIDDVPSVADLVKRLEQEYRDTAERLSGSISLHGTEA